MKNNQLSTRLVANLRILFCLLLLSMSCMVRAQVAGTGNIQGSVVDATGAVIPNASVTLTNLSTQVKRVTKSDSSGAYVFPNIEIGTYAVGVLVPGFKAYQQSGIVLEVGSSIAVNVSMSVGSEDQKVEVKADGLALQTEDVSFKQTIDQQDITEMPLNSASRQITGLLALSGGSAPAPAGDFTGSKYSYQTISIAIGGGGGNTTMWRLDGGDNNDYMANGNAPFPFPDAVAQFSVESTVMGAQDGMHSGGLVNVVTRSGTNTYHGAGFEFIRNNFIDATNFFSTTKDTLHQNQYGGTFGGPVRIPHLYNGKDKFFFFVGYQHLKNDQSTANTQMHVPTVANLNGDFSVTDPVATATHPAGSADTSATACNTTYTQLVDPITGAALVGNKYGAGSAPLPTWNAQALALQKYLPAINATVDANGCGLVSYAVPSQIYDNEFVTRIDYTINTKNHLYGRYFLDGYQAPGFFSPTNILFATPAPGNYERVQSATIGEDYTITSNLVNSAHITALRRRNNRQSAPGINACTVGIDIYCTVPFGLQMTVTNKFALYCGTCSPGHYNDNSFSFADDMTWVHGKHQVVFGGEYVDNELNIVGAYESNGVFTFNGGYSLSGPPGNSKPGDADLDFLEGAMSSYQQSKQQQNALRGPIPSLYVQDTYHATKKLTVVAGIRWSPQFMPVDYFNRGSIFSMSAFLANQVSSVYPTAPAGSLFYGDPGVTRQFTQNSPWQFSPNIGFSFDPVGNGRTVLRGGTELIYDEVNFFTAQRVTQNPPFATAVNSGTGQQLCLTTPWIVGGTGTGCAATGGTNTNPFPQPEVPTKAGAVFPAQGQFIVLPPHFHPSYTIQYTLSVQHQFSHDWQLSLDYIGNGTRHAPIAYPYDAAVFIPGVWGAGGTGCAGIVTTGPAAVKPGAAGTNCSTTANENSRFALTIANPLQGNQYDGSGAGSVVVGDYASANYNGMVASIQHRLSTSLSLLANYTWSKCLNEVDAAGDLTGDAVENPNNPRLDYGPCGSDFRNVENVVIVARSQFAFPNRIERALLNGWEIAPLTHILSGSPFTVVAGVDNSLTDVNFDRPNRVQGVPLYTHIANRSAAGAGNRAYLNPLAFAQVTAGCPTPVTATSCPQLGTYGNVGRNAYRGLPAYQFDASLSRVFPVYNRLNLTLRLEDFNVLNHPNFQNPAGSAGGNASFTSSTFGQLSSQSNAARVFQGSVKLNF